MSILGNMMSRIFSFGKKKKDDAAAKAAPAGGAATTPAVAQAPVAPVAPAAPVIQQLSDVDVAEVLEDLAAANPQKLNWRTSIVDLMKLLDMDSSLDARRDLADELGFTGDKKDSAAMNIWLHKAVIKAFAENGGAVPKELLD